MAIAKGTVRQPTPTQSTRIELDGREYVWNGRTWFDARSHQAPPGVVANRLNARLATFVGARDAEVTDFQGLLDLAKMARGAGQLQRAESAIRRAQALDPSSQPVLAILCSILRHRSAPERAVAATDGVEIRYAPLAVSRAAAFCDLERWEEARETLAIAFALGGSEEALEVRGRNAAQRPDLYEAPQP